MPIDVDDNNYFEHLFSLNTLARRVITRSSNS